MLISCKWSTYYFPRLSKSLCKGPRLSWTLWVLGHDPVSRLSVPLLLKPSES